MLQQVFLLTDTGVEPEDTMPVKAGVGFPGVRGSTSAQGAQFCA